MIGPRSGWLGRSRAAFAVALAVALGGGAAWGQDGELPAGHPAVADDDDGPADPHGGDPRGQNPHGGDPHGQSPHGDDGRALRDKLYNAPPDGSQDDAALKPGTIIATIRDADDKPVPNAPITLGVLHSSVAKGESRERLAKETDANGEARFDGLQFGSGTTYRVSTALGAANYAVVPFALGDSVGKRAVLHRYQATGDVEELLLGAQAIVYVALREDSLQIEQLVTIYNFSPTAWVADRPVALPARFKAFNKQESMDDARIEEVSGKGAALRGTFAPGRHDLDFRYQVPLDETERQSLRIELPPHIAQARVIVEAGKSMGADVAGFPAAERRSMNGKRALVTERAVRREEGGLKELEITISGLPTPGPGRWLAVALAAIAIVFGFSTLLLKQDGPDAEARQDLDEAREALLDELVTLEKMRESGQIGPKSYTRIRASLLDALARVVDKIALADAAAKRARPARARGAA